MGLKLGILQYMNNVDLGRLKTYTEQNICT